MKLTALLSPTLFSMLGMLSILTAAAIADPVPAAAGGNLAIQIYDINPMLARQEGPDPPADVQEPPTKGAPNPPSEDGGPAPSADDAPAPAAPGIPEGPSPDNVPDDPIEDSAAKP